MVVLQRIFLNRKGILASNIINSLRTMSTEQDVLFQENENKGIITLNRPKAINSLNLSMVNKLTPVLTKWEKEKMLVLIKGAGEKGFCAGGDVKAIVVAGLRGEKLGYEFFKNEYTLNGIIGTYKIPYIAFIDGIVMGGGVGLSVHGSYRVATERTLFAMPETAIGLFPDVGGSYVLPRLEGKLGLYLALTGARLKGSDVYKAGIATHFCPSQKLKDLEQELLNVKDKESIAAVLNKYHVNDNKDFSLKSKMHLINRFFAQDSVEAIIQALINDGTEWSQQTIATLEKMSPTSLKVTLKELSLGEHMGLLDCLQMEYRIAVGCLMNKDFYEGVRALLIDKDQKPLWKPNSLSKVTDEMVNEYFHKHSNDYELPHKL